ncbi:MAG: hypothetical protein JWR84_4211 [Caulobacter sp.]|nr:hypothetical protein [Caulobacter sp.]
MFKDERFRTAVAAVLAESAAKANASTYLHRSVEESLARMTQAVSEANHDRIWAHPAYRQVAQGMIAIGLPTVTDSGAMANALRDPLRFAVAIWSMGLALTPGGLTYSRFHGLIQLIGQGSRTLTYALFGYLRFVGYIEPAPGGGDRRERRFRPTPLLRAAFRGHIAKGLKAVGPLDPVAGRLGERMAREDLVYDEMIRRFSDGMLSGALVERKSVGNVLKVLNTRRSGTAMVWTLIEAAPGDETWPSTKPFPIRLAELARRSAVSRPHYMRMLRDGEKHGLLSLDAAGMLRITPALRDEINALVAFNIISFGLIAEFAHDVLDRDEAA